MMKYGRFLLIPALVAAFSCGGGETSPISAPLPPFVKGADISWASEMEADGVRFKKQDGTAAALLDVLKDCGFNAIRLRVWVDPYGGWSGKDDVLATARKVKAAGMDLMVDFHYSDFFADPSRQRIPAAWRSDKDNLEKMCRHVADHTRDVLQTLKDDGIAVKWVQVGNETRNGMLWPLGQLWTESGNTPDGRRNFARLYNAGYHAAKSVFAEAVVMPHMDNAYEDNKWWFDELKAQGGQFDAIALSHYPQAETRMSAARYNQQALNNIKALISAFGLPVFVAELGVKQRESDAASVLASFLSELGKIDQCAGVFYWEPQGNGSWKPEIYDKPEELSRYTGETISSPWIPYDQGAFTEDYRPSAILNCFAP